jgi:signal transduction protein with GAF and PtsI domain
MLTTKIKLYANREIDFTKDVKLQDNSDGKGVFIAEWNLDIPKPTIEQLNSYESQANTIENNEIQIEKRVKEYGSWQSQLDEIYHNGLDAWKQRIASIKTKYPKENN